MYAAGFITGFADQAVILPVIITAGLLMLLLGDRKAFLIWIVCTGATLSFVLLGKMTCYACSGFFPADWELHSPSGHTASAALVYGGLAALMIKTSRPFLVTAAASAFFGILIGATRLYLGVHTTGDVITGLTAGFTGAMLICLLHRKVPAGLKVSHSAGIAIPLLLVIAVMHGHNLDAEMKIQKGAINIWPWSMCS